MSKILIAWEMGGGMGHLTRLYPIAFELQKQGHQVWMAVRDVAGAQNQDPEENIPLLQAPFFTGRLKLDYLPIHFSEILLTQGFYSSQALQGLVRAWKAIFEISRPDLVLCDFAPTALLTAKIFGCTAASIGNGFCTPPAVKNLPIFRRDLPVSPKRIQDNAELVLNSINGVLSRYQQINFNCFSELFKTSIDLLDILPEFDPYPRTGTYEYIGVAQEANILTAFEWPQRKGKKVIAYLKTEHPGWKTVLIALSKLELNCVIYLAGANREDLAAFVGSPLFISKSPVNLSQALTTADACICHGGIGTIQQSLIAGVPLLLLPILAEQLLSSRKVCETGSSILVDKPCTTEDLSLLINNLLENKSYSLAAENISRKFPHKQPSEYVRYITEQLLQVLR